MRKVWGERQFEEVWGHASRDGPLASFKRLLEEVGLEGSFGAGGPEWQYKHSAHAKLDEALVRSDLTWVSQRRPGLRDAASIDARATRAIASRMAAQGPREAFESVIIGDMVTRHVTKHWQQHDGKCQCGLEEETVEHVFWRCPRYQTERQGAGRCGDTAARGLGACQRQLGVPARLPELEAWRHQQLEAEWLEPAWRAAEVFVDGSGRHPRTLP